mgnify:CR=1 FL=1
MININDHLDRRAVLIAERDALIAANEKETSWGAAVGARAARIAGINRALASTQKEQRE